MSRVHGVSFLPEVQLSVVRLPWVWYPSPWHRSQVISSSVSGVESNNVQCTTIVQWLQCFQLYFSKFADNSCKSQFWHLQVFTVELVVEMGFYSKCKIWNQAWSAFSVNYLCYHQPHDKGKRKWDKMVKPVWLPSHSFVSLDSCQNVDLKEKYILNNNNNMNSAYNAVVYLAWFWALTTQ